MLNLLLPSTTPLITQVSPNLISQGQTQTVTITGVNTTFAQGVTTISPIPGITFGPVTVSSPTLLTVPMTVSASAPAQPSPVLVITSAEQAVDPSGLTVQ